MLMDGLINGLELKKTLLSKDHEVRGPASNCPENGATIIDDNYQLISLNGHSTSEVAVQVSLSASCDGEFTFSCLWDSPGNALLQCNIVDGWIVGVPKIPTANHCRTDYEPPAKIRLIARTPVVAEPRDENKDVGRAFNTGVAVVSKGSQVNLPINPNCEALRLSDPNSRILLAGCTGFHGFSSITSGIDWKIRSLCGIPKSVFDLYLSRVYPVASWGITKETVLLMFFTKLRLGLSFANLAIFFGSDGLSLSHMFNDTLAKLYLHSEKDIVWQTRSNELPPYFQGLYKESRVILICLEVEVEQPKDEQLRHNLYSSSRMYSYKFVIGMTPDGRVCFKSKAYEGRRCFKRVLKDCGFLSLLSPKELVLTRSITPEMAFIIKRGVLLVAPQPANISSADDVEEDIVQHLESCEKRLKFFKVLNKVPIALTPNIDKLVHLCCCLINELPLLVRHDQPEDDES